MNHLLNLRALASEQVDEFLLLGFEGREAMSESFEWRLDLITLSADVKPVLTEWIGQLAEFDISPHDGDPRVFAGRIYGARLIDSDDAMRRFQVTVGPAYHVTQYGRTTHFVQDRNSVDIFEALTANVPGLVKEIKLTTKPPKRPYVLRYDESEFDFIGRLLAEDGITFFFVYDRNGGSYRHKMLVGNSPASYVPDRVESIVFNDDGMRASIKTLERHYDAAPGSQQSVWIDVAHLNKPIRKDQKSKQTWSAVYSRSLDLTTGGTAAEPFDDAESRSRSGIDHIEQGADHFAGTSTDPGFQAGGRVSVHRDRGSYHTNDLVLTQVIHSAYDPWMLPEPGPAWYRNSFAGIDAGQSFRPSTERYARRAPGPILGTVMNDSTQPGEAVVDGQWRVPVTITATHPGVDEFAKIVWLPVKQQWASGTYGAQFFPRIGARVIIDFLYGNPDLPFITGSMYSTLEEIYPFDPKTTPTRSGWRSITDKNGLVKQEFHFEDKPGKEEIYLYTGRDYRRVVDKNDWGTVKQNQTLGVWHDRTLTVGHDQKTEIKNDRTLEVKGKQQIDITKTHTMKVLDKSKHESLMEIELVVGTSSIKLTPTGIEIKGMMISVEADVIAKIKAGAMLQTQAPMIQESADGPMLLKGGIVMIN